MLEISLSNFRSFKGDVIVPLDADVVLVYGPNGSGKTSLLSAIELGLTGCVPELSKFSADYPRCLLHIRGDSTGSVVVKRAQTGTINEESRVSINSTGPVKASGILAQADLRFFKERCYLSQSHLGRLLELYQAVDSHSGEQPLVRFVKDLLNLDSLENITDGLFDLGDVRRVVKTSRTFANLRIQKDECDKLKAAHDAQQRMSAVKSSQSRAAATAVMELAGDPGPQLPWTAAGLAERRRILESVAEGTDYQNRISTLKSQIDALGRAKDVLLDSKMVEAESEGEKVSERLRASKSRRDEIESQLKGESDLILAGLTAINEKVQVVADTGRQLLLLETSLNAIVVTAEDNIRIAQQDQTRLSALQLQQKQLVTEMSKGAPRHTDIIQRQRQWQEVLSLLLNGLESDRCPVCDRNYLEVGQGSLREHLVGKLESIGGDIEALEAAAKLQAEREAELLKVTQQSRALEARELPRRLADLSSTLAKADELRNRLAATKERRGELANISQSVAGLISELEILQIRRKQRSDSVKTLDAVADAIEHPRLLAATNVPVYIESVLSSLTKRLADLSTRQQSRTQLLTAIQQAERDALAAEEDDKKTLRLKAEYAQIAAAEARVDLVVESARRLVRAATSAKKKGKFCINCSMKR